MPKISIIIPCYKVEQYISKCLDSIQSQIFQDWEAICIDDGSPDNTGKILDEYANKDSRIKVIHQENSGVSSARNRGIDNATGEYIGFVDPDDWIDCDYYKTLIDEAEKNNADVVQCGYTIFKDSLFNKVVWKKSIATSFVKIIKELKRGYVCNKIWKSDLIKKNDIRFNESICCSEDLLFSIMASNYIKYFINLDYAGYIYRYNENSATNNSMQEQKNRKDCYRVCELILKFLENRNLREINAVKTFLVHNFFSSKKLKNKDEYNTARCLLGCNMLLIKNRFIGIKKNIFSLSVKHRKLTLFGHVYNLAKETNIKRN